MSQHGSMVRSGLAVVGLALSGLVDAHASAALARRTPPAVRAYGYQTMMAQAADGGDPRPASGPTDAPGGKPATSPTDTSRPPSGTQATVVGFNALEGVISKSVRSKTGNEDMGRIVDVLVGANGQVRAAVIDFGGFLGVGSRKVAVDWKVLDFTDSIKSGNAKVLLSRDQVRQSPEYKPGEPVVILEDSRSSGATPPASGTVDAPTH